MAAIPGPVTELLESALVGRADGRRPQRSARDLSPHPVVGRRARLHDLVDPVQPQAGAHRGERQGLGVDHGSDLGRRSNGSRDDPGRRQGHRRRPAWRLGTSAADLVGEGAGDRLVPQGARGAAALLRARAHRDLPAPCPVLADRATHPRRRRSSSSGRRPRDAFDPRDRRASRPRQARRPTPSRSRPGWTTAATRSRSPSRRPSTRGRSPRRSTRRQGSPSRRTVTSP